MVTAKKAKGRRKKTKSAESKMTLQQKFLKNGISGVLNQTGYIELDYGFGEDRIFVQVTILDVCDGRNFCGVAYVLGSPNIIGNIEISDLCEVLTESEVQSRIAESDKKEQRDAIVNRYWPSESYGRGLTKSALKSALEFVIEQELSDGWGNEELLAECESLEIDPNKYSTMLKTKLRKLLNFVIYSLVLPAKGLEEE